MDSGAPNWLNHPAFKLARLHGLGGKIAAIVIAALFAVVGCFKYAASATVQLVAMGGLVFVACFALMILAVYAWKHPEKVLLEGAEVVEFEQLRMKNQSPGLVIDSHLTAGRTRKLSEQKTGQ